MTIGTDFIVRYLYSSGSMSNAMLCRVTRYGSATPYSTGCGLRPVFLIPSDIIISSGDGSENNPYIIE